MLLPKDWLRLRLTGAAATDPTDASGTLLFDIARDAWATGVADALGLRTDLLPPIRPSARIAGYLQPGPARQLGLRPGLPVATGAADTAASLLAAGLAAGQAAGSPPAGACSPSAPAASSSSRITRPRITRPRITRPRITRPRIFRIRTIRFRRSWMAAGGPACSGRWAPGPTGWPEPRT